MALANLFRDRRESLGKTQLVGIIKEVAPVSGAETDEVLSTIIRHRVFM